LTCPAPSTDTDSMLQMSVNREFEGATFPPTSPRTLAELKQGESGIIDRLDLPEDVARRLMELGFLPGHVVVPARSAPGGEPRVYRVDGSEVALRRETAARLILRPPSKSTTKTVKP
jgi:ferrous iron transport protein A